MNNEFTRMQKLAGIITESYVPGSNPDIDDESATMALDMAGIPEGKKKLTKEEAKQIIKDAILAEMHPEDPDEMESVAWDMAMREEEEEIAEALPDAMNRMDSLVDQNAKFTLIKTVRSIIRDLKMEDFEEDDIFDYVMDLVKTLPDKEESYYDADEEQKRDEEDMRFDDEDLPLEEAKKDEEGDEVEIEDKETVEEPAADEDMIDADMKAGS